MFTHDADFSGLTREKIHVKHMFQKAFVEMNEEGTEAAAASGEL